MTEGAEPDGDVTLEELQAGLDRTGPEGARVTEVEWASRFRINQRRTRHQAVGRVFLAGDAAHIHSLVGAQGMNTGIQDAVNLAWKLALHLREGAPRALLDTYEEERGAVARRLVKGTTRFTRLTLLSRPITTALRRNVAPRVLSRPFIRDRIAEAVSQIDVAYPESPLRGGTAVKGAPAPGDRLPDARLAAPGEGGRVHLLSLLRAGRHLLLFFAGDQEAGRALRHWEALRAELERVTARDAAGSSDPFPLTGAAWIVPEGRRFEPASGITALTDPGGTAHQRHAFTGGGYLLIRPDGYIAVRGRPDQAEPLREYLRRWLPVGQGARQEAAGGDH